MSISAANGIENCKLCVVYIFIDTKKNLLFVGKMTQRLWKCVILSEFPNKTVPRCMGCGFSTL